ncbi:hypothetical protein ABW19_dt0206058 [Dactylella cylindrospora]|nr:hypothetical protein ABW19_dt0206058 [Dactylella cylindrospora]
MRAHVDQEMLSSTSQVGLNDWRIETRAAIKKHIVAKLTELNKFYRTAALPKEMWESDISLPFHRPRGLLQRVLLSAGPKRTYTLQYESMPPGTEPEWTKEGQENFRPEEEVLYELLTNPGEPKLVVGLASQLLLGSRAVFWEISRLRRLLREKQSEKVKKRLENVHSMNVEICLHPKTWIPRTIDLSKTPKGSEGSEGPNPLVCEPRMMDGYREWDSQSCNPISPDLPSDRSESMGGMSSLVCNIQLSMVEPFDIVSVVL